MSTSMKEAYIFVMLTYRAYLDMDISLPDERVHHYTDLVIKHVVKMITDFRRLFLVEDMIDSIKVLYSA